MLVWIFLGAPCVGKGVQSRLLRDLLGLHRFDTGEELRAIGEGVSSSMPPALSAEIKTQIDAGILVDDGLVCEMVADQIERNKGSIILDGFPRTVGQVNALIAKCARHGYEYRAIHLTAKKQADLSTRVSVRLKTERRADDANPQSFTSRVTTYQSNIGQIVERLGSHVIEVDGSADVMTVHASIVAAIKARSQEEGKCLANFPVKDDQGSEEPREAPRRAPVRSLVGATV